MTTRQLSLILAAALIAFNSQAASAKCAEMKFYYCANAVFEKEMPELSITGFGKQYCMGSIRLGRQSVTAVFMDKQPCPEVGANLVGHLASLCQNTGLWTLARYTYTREPDFCTKKYEESIKRAQAKAATIQPGMTRSQVREAMKDFVPAAEGSLKMHPYNLDEYYLHPDIVLLIPFDEPNGAYSQENKVNGPVIIEKEVPPSPADDSLRTGPLPQKIAQHPALSGKPVRNIELTEARDIADASEISAAIDALFKDAAPCPSPAKERQTCGCSFTNDLKKLNSAYSAAAAKHPEWNEEDTVVAYRNSANDHSVILSLPGVKRQLDACAHRQR